MIDMMTRRACPVAEAEAAIRADEADETTAMIDMTTESEKESATGRLDSIGR
jgi:hypothetical protein